MSEATIRALRDALVEGGIPPSSADEVITRLQEEPTLGGGGGDLSQDSNWSAAGDLAVGAGPAAGEILPVGTEGQILTVTDVGSGVLKPRWGSQAAVTGDITQDAIWTGNGQMLRTNGSGVVEVLDAGTNTNVLTMVAGLPAWGAAPTVSVDTSLPYADLINSGISKTAGKFYSPSGDDGTTQEKRLAWASKANRLLWIIDSSPRFLGAYTLADALAIGGLAAGDSVLATDIGPAPGTYIVYTGSRFVADEDVLIETCFQVNADAQSDGAFASAATWSQTVAANMMPLFRFVECDIHLQRASVVNDANSKLQVELRMGTQGYVASGTTLTDTTIATWKYLDQSNSTALQRTGVVQRFRINDLINKIQPWGVLQVTGMMGSVQTDNLMASYPEVTLGTNYDTLQYLTLWADDGQATPAQMTASILWRFIR